MTATNTDTLDNRRVALLVTDGYERSELHEPLNALREAGADAVVITPKGDAAKSWKDGDWGDSIDADASLKGADAGEFDGLVLPGGVMNPDSLRINDDAVAFIKRFFELDRPVAAICHGPWTLIEAGVLAERKVTSWPSLRKDLENAGAHWVDEEVVCDRGLVTSRNPDDLPAFCAKIIEEIHKSAART